jgi:excisionase family DNA binding protein
MGQLLSVADVATMLQVSKPTVWRLVRLHGLPAVRPSGDLRFREEDIAKWLESRKVGASA